MTISMSRRTLKALQQSLRAIGFRRTSNDRSTTNPDVQIYERGDRSQFSLEAQLWGDGVHRIAHWKGGRMTVPPTEFRNCRDLETAIAAQESFRGGGST